MITPHSDSLAIVSSFIEAIPEIPLGYDMGPYINAIRDTTGLKEVADDKDSYPMQHVWRTILTKNRVEDMPTHVARQAYAHLYKLASQHAIEAAVQKFPNVVTEPADFEKGQYWVENFMPMYTYEKGMFGEGRAVQFHFEFKVQLPMPEVDGVKDESHPHMHVEASVVTVLVNRITRQSFTQLGTPA